MKGIYVETNYWLLLTLIYFYIKKNDIIYFLDEKIEKYINLKNVEVISLKNFKDKKGIVQKYYKWKLNNQLLLKLGEVDEIYLQDHVSYGQFFLNNFNGKMILLEDGTMNYNEKILLEEKNRKLKKIKINHFIKKLL